MELTEKLLSELQKRLKIGNRKGVHLNAIPANSRYKFDLNRLSHIDKDLPNKFIQSLLSEQPLKFRISWKDNLPDLNSLFEDDKIQLVKITKAFENLINQTDAIESEKGINTFGFGFPILVRRDQTDNKLTVAPILIWSLKIVRTKEFNTWLVTRNEDDPIYLNEVLINHLQNDSNIVIEQISNNLLDDGIITRDELVDICVNLIKSINLNVSIDLKEDFKKKFENVIAIGDKAHYEKLSINSTNALIDFGGLFSIFEIQKQNIINDYSNLMEMNGISIVLDDIVGHSFQSISSVETDPSQQSILHSLEATRNILIQGPPGTGKSQTLTAILINALENRKRTIVVCEKRTALDVLHSALINKGLNNHCVLIRDIVKDRRTVVDSVRNRVDNSEYKSYNYIHSKGTLDSIISKAHGLISKINVKHKKVGENMLGNKSWTDIVGILISLNRVTDEIENINFKKNHFNYSEEELSSILNIIELGQALYWDFDSIRTLSFINSDKLIGNNPYLLEQQIKKSFDNYADRISVIKLAEKEYSEEYKKIRNSELKCQLDQNDKNIASVRTLLQCHQEDSDFFNESKTQSFTYIFLSLFSKKKRNVLRDQASIKILFSKLDNGKDLKICYTFSNSLNENISKLEDVKKLIEEIVSNFDSQIDNEYNGLKLLDFIEEEHQTKSLDRLKIEVSELKENFNNENWTSEKFNAKDLKTFIGCIERNIDKKNQYFNNEKDLFTVEFKWFQFYNELSEDNKLIINELKHKSDWRNTFLIYYLNSLLLNYANIDLPTNADDHSELAEILKSMEKVQLKYIQEYWISKQIKVTKEFEQRNNNLTVENLYNKRSGSRFKRKSLRQIVQYDPDLFSSFFPIILTSPDVCSNLFSGQNDFFDIVMFDEASQLRLEDNLPAILKGKQIIIAGDEHQMPPSNYFSKVFDGSIEDEDDLDEEDEITIDKDNILLSCESLLDFGLELNFEKKHLDFHYRSRHPYLIDFSNYAFYEQRLKPLPNNFEYTPISFIQSNGVFCDHTNEEEAEMVLSIIENNIHKLPNGEYPTIGVATFNIAQRNLIKSKILERQRFSKYEKFNAKIQELEENGMFIKNLENIQGDERDVIILSTTYGVGKDGKFVQRFGPINHSKGYKLLNVIITRAKYKVYVCTSIPEKIFLNYKEYLFEEGSNNKRAVFYAYIAYSKAVSEKNDELRLAVLNSLGENSSCTKNFETYNQEEEFYFEEEVYQILTQTFGDDKLSHQVQFAGFKIDIVYDSKKLGVPKIAIECDGAKNHLSREAYLYDRHREKILENNGFVFHRIWSTNWWRNTKSETAKLINFINTVETKSNIKINSHSKASLAFTDHFEINKKNDQPVTSKEVKSEVKTNNTTEKSEVKQVKLPLNEVMLNSVVKVMYMNSGTSLYVKLMKEVDPKNESVNGIQKINVLSPLAISLMGRSIGEIVKVGSLDKYVEILEIKNE